MCFQKIFRLKKHPAILRHFPGSGIRKSGKTDKIHRVPHCKKDKSIFP